MSVDDDQGAAPPDQGGAHEPSESRFRRLFDIAATGLVISSPDGRILDVNAEFQEMIGRSEAELRELDIMAITHADDRAPSSDLLDRLRNGESRATVQKRYRHRDGSVVHARTTVSPVLDDGRLQYLVSSIENFEPALRTLDRLSRSETLRRLAGSLALVGGWSVEATPDRTTYWSDELFAVLDAPVGQEPVLQEAFLLYPEPDRTLVSQAIDRCFRFGEPFDLELSIDTFSGRRIPVRVIGEPEFGPDGRLERVVGAFQDISEILREREQAARAAEQLAETFETMSDAAYVLDSDWNFTFLNRRAEVLMHRGRGELLGRNVWDEFPEAADSELFDVFHRALEEGTTEHIDEFFFEPFDTWFTITVNPSSNGLAVYFRDVTASHEARRLLVQQAELLDAAQDAIMVCDADGTVRFWNRGAERIYGWTAEEAVGSKIRALMSNDSRSGEAVQVVLRDGHWSGELVHPTRDGGTVTIAGRWTLASDAEGRPSAVLVINTDVTEQRRVEQQLMRSQRLESIGTLASGISHDLNNMLLPISLAAGLLADELDSADDLSLVRTIESNALRGGELVSKVLSFARGFGGERVHVDVIDVLDGVAAMVRDTFPKNVTFSLGVADDVPAVFADPTQLQQVVLNLVVNARDAMPDGGDLAITTGVDEIDEVSLAGMPECEPGRYVVVDVEDSGIGMAADVLDRIFDPFFTTKPLGSGTGLGLATTRKILRDHRGFVRVYSEPGRGSRFRIGLPGANPPPVEPDAVEQRLAPPPRGDGQLVLVVDDEPAIRTMVARTLEAAGYRVVTAGDGAEAIEVFAREAASVSVAVVDMMMPVMDGPATITALREIDPGVAVIAVSGLASNQALVPGAEGDRQSFLPKPFTSHQLLTTLAHALQGRA